VLAVRVTAPATDGRANAAVIAALADALKVPKRNVRIVAGGSSRIKHVEISADVSKQLGRLLEAP
jgi:uncharacterized protein YggU (UPF0235/DUF167 family)